MPSLSLPAPLFGLTTPRVSIEVFAPVFLDALTSILPSRTITRSAGIDLHQGWKTVTKEVVQAHEDHLREVWALAHEALVSVRPGGWRYGGVWRRTIQASDAYGRTIAAYVEFRQLWLAELMATDTYFKARRTGRRWDERAAQRTGALVDALDRLDEDHPADFQRLLPGGGIPEGVQEIARRVTDLAGEQRFGAVAEFV